MQRGELGLEDDGRGKPLKLGFGTEEEEACPGVGKLGGKHGAGSGERSVGVSSLGTVAMTCPSRNLRDVKRFTGEIAAGAVFGRTVSLGPWVYTTVSVGVPGLDERPRQTLASLLRLVLAPVSYPTGTMHTGVRGLGFGWASDWGTRGRETSGEISVWRGAGTCGGLGCPVSSARRGAGAGASGGLVTGLSNWVD